MSFSPQQALAICTANLRKRKNKASIAYILYYTNDANRIDGQMSGSTIKALIDEFRQNKANFKYAFIVKRGDEGKYLRFYNRDEGKKFFSMTRTKKK